MKNVLAARRAPPERRIPRELGDLGTLQGRLRAVPRC